MKLLVLVSLWCFAAADLPVDCRYSDVVGEWVFFETTRNDSAGLECNKLDGEIEHTKTIKLMYPNKAVDDFGNEGTWTMIYNQGFEVRVAGRLYFAFSYYENKASYCDRTFTGWSRGITVRNWSCFNAKKTTTVPPRPFPPSQEQIHIGAVKRNYHELVDEINIKQDNWEATVYPNMDDLYKSLKFRQSKAPMRSDLPVEGLGETGNESETVQKPKANFFTRVKANDIKRQFRSFDWRNVDGTNFVRPVKAQGNCGSCYAFASIGAIESQVLIHSNGTDQIDLSAQDIVGCSKLSQGCDGGFPYLIAGRYGQEEGLVPSDCVPYSAGDLTCYDRSSCRKIYTAEYNYVGGYYGACNEEEMIVALVNDGPLAVGIMVYPDFMTYKSGIYHHTKTSLSLEYDPLEVTNHAVLLVGYGESEETGEKYWIIQNSWGPGWGMDGYVYIRRGTDEIAVESLAVRAVAYP